MIIFVFAILMIALFFSVSFRVVLLHPFATAGYFLKDALDYFRYKKWRNCRTGVIVCYIGLFGKGKTLSVVHEILQGYYRRYNDLKVYDPFRKKWVTQKVHIISNVDLIGVPYERFVSLSQLVSVAERYRDIDEKDDTLTVHLVLGDEFSVQLNSRSFKSNIDPLFLNTLLTCRHHHISLFYTSQRFNHVDALLRQVTSYVISCRKCWRVMVQAKYDAYELENTYNPLDVKPLARFGWFIRDKDYAAYDTLACVDSLGKSCREGDMLSESDILALQQNTPSDTQNISRPSRRFLQRMKRLKK